MQTHGAAVALDESLVVVERERSAGSEYSTLVRRKLAEFAHLAPQYELQCLLWSFGRIRAIRRKTAQLAVSGVEGPVLELCCGTGGVTIELSRRFEHVVGVDLSPDMLARNHRRLDKAGVTNVTLREAEVSTLRFQDESFAAVVISLGLHELPRQIRDQVFARSAKWLRPGGRFVLCDNVRPRNRFLAAIIRWAGRHMIEEEFFDEYLGYSWQQQLERHGFALTERERVLLSCIEISAWTRP